MVTGRKGGASSVNGKSELSLGDLVLAKVKGFPFWPAKISKPEDWQQLPDPRKYFVEFFGTKEIAFVAPVDIQAFTCELKSKLLNRCQSKQMKYFNEAANEISEAFEKLEQNKPDDLKEDTEGSDIQCKGSAVDGKNHESKKDGTSTTGRYGMVTEGLYSFRSGLGRCSNKLGETDSPVIKPSTPGHGSDGLSPDLSAGKNYVSDGVPPKRETSLASTPENPSNQRENVTGDKVGENIGINHSKVMTGRNSLSSRRKNCIFDSEDDSTSDLIHGKNDDFAYATVQHRAKNPEATQKALVNGHKLKKIIAGSEKRREVSKSVVTPMKDDSARGHDIPECGDHLKDGMKRKIAFRNGAENLSPNSSKKAKDQLRIKKSTSMADDMHKTARSQKQGKDQYSGTQHGKHITGANNIVHPAKKFKCADSEWSHPISVKTVSPSFNVVDKLVKHSDFKRSTSAVKAEIHSESRVEREMVVALKAPNHETVLPLSKRHHRAFKAVSDSTMSISNDKTEKNSPLLKNDVPSFNRGLSIQSGKKRRAVCLYDDEDEFAKTPVHGGCARNVAPASAADTIKIAEPKHDSYQDTKQIIRYSNALEVKHPKQSSSRSNESQPSSKQTLEKRPKKVATADVPRSHAKFESYPSEDTKSVTEPHKITKAAAKVSSFNTPKKIQATSGKGTCSVYGSSNSLQNQVTLQRNKSASSAERSKTLPKSNTRMNGFAALEEVSYENSSLSCERQEADIEDKTRSSSMKHLIAVAQAKRKRAHSPIFSLDNSDSTFISTTDLHKRSQSPSSALQPSLAGTSSLMHEDIHGSYYHKKSGSPSAVYQPLSQNQLNHEEVKEKRVSSGHRVAGGSLSGGTEAAVARDAFEGMIETLSRNKESIGRATRLAIDCAKYGIANQVVDLLIRKLETEPISHRKVDIFFLVDSITQCSHSQQGIAGASYIPAVQAALPRLLGAAVSVGDDARENRLQCRKVLQLWLERKILPESLLRRYIDNIGVSNDNVSAGFFLKRPSRAERAVDDPLREMEDMMVDEYGSNATFQLPAFLSCHVFEDDDEDLPSSSCMESGNVTLVEPTHTLGESETYVDDRRHCVLEDVDGELEMEDASGQPKDDRPFSTIGSIDMALQQQDCDKILESVSNNSPHWLPLPEGSPPLPHDSPPPLPPLPSSPPPLSPSPPPSSPPRPPSPTTAPPALPSGSPQSLPPLPPLPSSPPPPPPPLSPSPPPPSPPSSLPTAPAQPYRPPQSLSPPLPGPPTLMVSQLSAATQSLLPPQSALPPQLVYRPPVSQEYCSVPSGNHGNLMDASVEGELFQQMSPSFEQSGPFESRDPSGFSSSRQLEHRQNDLYMIPQASQPNQKFQLGNARFGQRSSHRALPLPPSNTFSYSKPTVQHHNQHPYSRTYPIPSHSDGRSLYVTDEQWRLPASQLNVDNQRGIWMSGSRTRSRSGPLLVQEAYFRSQHEKPPSNTTSFQYPDITSPQARAPVRGGPVLSRRSTMPARHAFP